MNTGTGWGHERAADVARRAARAVGVCGDVQPVRVAVTAVFRIGHLAVKVMPTTHRSLEDARTESTLLHALLAEGFPVVVPVGEPFERDGCVIVMTRWLEADPGSTTDWSAVGRFLRSLHELDEPLRFASPYDPSREDELFAARLTKLRRADQVTAAEERALLSRLETGELVDAPEFVLCHGNIHTENLVVTRGETHVLDWEKACVGPRAIDLASLVARVARYGMPELELERFAAAYGADPRSFSGINTIRTRKEISGITYLLLSPGQVQQAEGRRRLDDLMSADHQRRAWADV